MAKQSQALTQFVVSHMPTCSHLNDGDGGRQDLYLLRQVLLLLKLRIMRSVTSCVAVQEQGFQA